MVVDPKQVIDDYLRSLQGQRGLAAHSLSNYKRELRVLNDELLTETPITSVSSHHIRKLMASHHQGGLAASSLARRLSAWRGFFDWACRQGLAAVNPCKGIKAPKLPKRLPKALPPDSALALMEHGVGSTTPEDARDRAILELLYSSGLRLSELVFLDWRYFNHKNGNATYESTGWLQKDEAQVEVLGKGKKRRSVPVGSQAMTYIEQWLRVRESFRENKTIALDELSINAIGLSVNAAMDADAALFLGKQGRRISPRVVQQLVRNASLRSGVNAKVHPHVLRHSFASHILQSSGDLRAVQELLGHANIATTQVYTSLDFQRLAAVYDAAHPRAGITAGTTNKKHD
jgi:integrase/recombinase XerC